MLFALAGFVYVVLAVVIYKRAVGLEGASAANAVGQVLAPLIIAAVVRGIYVLLRWRWTRLPVTSGWVLVLAAAFAFVLSRSPSS